MAVKKIDLTATIVTRYNVPPCNRLWLPKVTLEPGGGVVTNPADAVLAISLNDDDDFQPWAIQDGFVTSAGKALDHFFVRVVTKGAAAALYLCTGTDLSVGYGNTDGLSPEVGGSNGAGDSLRFDNNLRRGQGGTIA